MKNGKFSEPQSYLDLKAYQLMKKNIILERVRKETLMDYHEYHVHLDDPELCDSINQPLDKIKYDWNFEVDQSQDIDESQINRRLFEIEHHSCESMQQILQGGMPIFGEEWQKTSSQDSNEQFPVNCSNPIIRDETSDSGHPNEERKYQSAKIRMVKY